VTIPQEVESKLRRFTRVLAGAAAIALVPLAATATSTAASGATGAPVQRFLQTQLNSALRSTVLPVLVHGTDIAAARHAVAASGMGLVASFDKIGVAVARGTSAQIGKARIQPGVTYLEGDQPITFFLSTSNTATRGEAARQTLTGADGKPLDGHGVSVAVIDTGIDPTHPFFKEADGSTAVVKNLKSLCVDESSQATNCIVDVPTTVDTDTVSVGGHGTHVNGIVAGRPVTLADGTKLHGAAPGAKLVSISTGAVLLIIGADAALNWVLENHNAPCGASVPASICPPIKSINNSYGPQGGGNFDPNSATAKLQEAIAGEGVVTVWANGNDGGDGSANQSNPPGQDPTPGVLSVASYYDQNTGTRNGTLSSFSSRGLKTDQSTWPDISAPGESIQSSCRPYLPICSTGLKPVNGPGPLDIGTFNTISGTSMAAPHIAGIVAQLFQARPGATPAQIEAALKASAYKYTNGAPYTAAGPYTSSYDKGTGLVDVVAAVQYLLSH
jgi:serine protease AprX